LRRHTILTISIAVWLDQLLVKCWCLIWIKFLAPY
jgi:hypothetical protein